MKVENAGDWHTSPWNDEVHYLNPGETQTVQFTLGPDELSYLNRDMKRVVEPGAFEVMAGGNSVELITVILNVVNH